MFRRLGLATLIVVALLSVGALKFVRDAYPADPFKSAALRNCVAHDPGFVRYFAEDRAHCYARQPQISNFAHTN